MYCMKVGKVCEHRKYETIACLVITAVHNEILSVMKMEHSQTNDFVGITFFGHVILKRHDCFISRLEVLLFLCQYKTFVLNLMDLNIHATIKRNCMDKYVR